MIRATVGVYPMRQQTDIGITSAIETLRASGVEVEVRAMNSELAGDPDAVWSALRNAFEAADKSGPTVMTVVISSACGV